MEITPEDFEGYVPEMQEVIEKYSYIDEKRSHRELGLCQVRQPLFATAIP